MGAGLGDIVRHFCYLGPCYILKVSPPRESSQEAIRQERQLERPKVSAAPPTCRRFCQTVERWAARSPPQLETSAVGQVNRK